MTCCSSKGAVPTNFSYDDVKCTGREDDLDECPHYNVENCTPDEGAGVYCLEQQGYCFYSKNCRSNTNVNCYLKAWHYIWLSNLNMKHPNNIIANIQNITL